MTQPNFSFSPVKSAFGPGCLSLLAAELRAIGASKVFVMTDDKMMNTLAFKTVENSIRSANAQMIVWTGIDPNPTDESAVEATDIYLDQGADLILSLGGGSAHDCAKATAILATNPGTIHDYEGVDKVINPIAPLVCVNTTAGTAAEMTRFTIITDTKRKVKMAIIDWRTTPLVAFNDPETMQTMPADLTAATGLDALTHAVEAYVSTAATPLTDANATAAIRLIFDNLEAVVSYPEDMHAREKMAYAEFMAGLAFNNAGLGYVHAMAHQLGGVYDLPHGVCNAILLPVVQRYNSEAAELRLAELADVINVTTVGMNAKEKAALFIEEIDILKTVVNIPKGLKELDVKTADFELMAKNAMKDPCGATNPVQPDLSQVIGMFQQAY